MAQTRLNEDLNFVQRAPLTITALDGDLNIIAKLDDEPNDVGGLTAQQLKAEFDRAGNTIKTYLNETLIPEIVASDAAERSREEGERGREAAEGERAAAETARASAETGRVSAEEARVQAELAREDQGEGIIARTRLEARRAEVWENNAQAYANSGQLMRMLSDGSIISGSNDFVFGARAFMEVARTMVEGGNYREPYPDVVFPNTFTTGAANFAAQAKAWAAGGSYDTWEEGERPGSTARVTHTVDRGARQWAEEAQAAEQRVLGHEQSIVAEVLAALPAWKGGEF